MAESVKRRVAAARLAVAFVAAGAITGAAYAQAGGGPPSAKESLLVSSIKSLKLDSSNIKAKSLLFSDFKTGQVPSFNQFIKLQNSFKSLSQTVSKKYETKSDAADAFGKIENAGYIKVDAADSRYLKADAPVVRGDGSVMTATGQSTAAKDAVPILNVPNLFTLDAAGPTVTITNTSGKTLTYTACSGAAAGTLADGKSLVCDANGGGAQTVQLIGTDATGAPQVSTVNFSAITPVGASLTTNTVQVLIGL